MGFSILRVCRGKSLDQDGRLRQNLPRCGSISILGSSPLEHIQSAALPMKHLDSLGGGGGSCVKFLD